MKIDQVIALFGSNPDVLKGLVENHQAIDGETKLPRGIREHNTIRSILRGSDPDFFKVFVTHLIQVMENPAPVGPKAAKLLGIAQDVMETEFPRSCNERVHSIWTALVSPPLSERVRQAFDSVAHAQKRAAGTLHRIEKSKGDTKEAIVAKRREKLVEQQADLQKQVQAFLATLV